jgi:hypothetical protein
MKNIIKKILSTVVASIAFIGLVSSVSLAGESKTYYQNDKGLSLSESEYQDLNELLSESAIDYLSEKEYMYIKKNVTLKDVASETIIIQTVETVDDKGKVSTKDECISEKEYNDKVNLRSASVYSMSDWKDQVITPMKKITLEYVNVEASKKKAVLTCEWLSIPQCKSFDVLAMRVNQASLTANIKGTNNVEGKQYYDGNVITYSYKNGNIKYLSNGLGLSTNIVDTTSRSLKCSLSVIFATGADPFTVYGSYQHAVNNISLSQSQSYTISSSGMGGVINFSSSVWNKYDKTPGLVINGGLSDIR